MRLIDADALIKSVDGNRFITDSIKDYVKLSVDAQPTIEPEDKCSECDAWNKYKNYSQPELIRCKDCKHYDGRPCGKVDWYNSADDYCSRGERKPDEE